MNKHLHEQIGITFRELGALLGARNMLAVGLVEHDYEANADKDAEVRALKGGRHLFDMNVCGRQSGCGTVGCIGGLMGVIMGDRSGDYVANKGRPHLGNSPVHPLVKLFYPHNVNADWRAITPVQAVRAIDQFLNTKGKKAWEGILD